MASLQSVRICSEHRMRWIRCNCTSFSRTRCSNNMPLGRHRDHSTNHCAVRSNTWDSVVYLIARYRRSTGTSTSSHAPLYAAQEYDWARHRDVFSCGALRKYFRQTLRLRLQIFPMELVSLSFAFAVGISHV